MTLPTIFEIVILSAVCVMESASEGSPLRLANPIRVTRFRDSDASKQ